MRRRAAGPRAGPCHSVVEMNLEMSRSYADHPLSRKVGHLKAYVFTAKDLYIVLINAILE